MKLGAKGLGAVIAVDRGSDRPVYAQIADGLRTAIEDGTLLPGARLASTRSLATDWGVSRNTVLQAFEALLAEGYLEGRVGDGTYVTGTPPANPSSGPSQTGETAGQAGPQRLSPAFCFTLLPGFSAVPLALAVMFRTERFSVTISRCSRTSRAVVRWRNALRRLATLRCRRAINRRALAARLDRLPRRALDKACCCSLIASASASRWRPLGIGVNASGP